MSHSSTAENQRLDTERQTIRAMVQIYCRGNHLRVRGGELCEDCQALLDYAMARLDRCPNVMKKPPCSKCTVHCYKPSRREQIKAVMRYAGPRMLWRHPIMALRHWLQRG
jgi:predicted amidophosphoribosyltransferase